MKLHGICFYALLTIFCSAVCSQTRAGEDANQKPVWKTILSYNDWTDREPAIMRMPDGYLVAGISHHKTDEGQYEFKVVLWKIDLQGKELWVKDVNLPAWQGNFIPDRCFAVPNEQMLFITESLGPKPRRAWLLKFDNAGSVVFSKEFLPNQVFDIQGLRKTIDGFLLYGSVHKGAQNSNACVTKLDTDGNEIWRREYDKGKMEWGMGLAPQKDGGFVLSADSGIYNKFGGGPSNAWIIKCDPNGSILREIILEGRHPTVAVNDNITAVIFNKENFPQQDIAVVGLNENLETIWKIDSLFGKAGGLGMLAAIVNEKGNFVLAGNKFLSAEIWEINIDGKILDEITIEGAEQCVRLELLQTPAGYLVAGAVSKMSEMPRTSDGKRDENIQWDTDDILVAEVADLAK